MKPCITYNAETYEYETFTIPLELDSTNCMFYIEEQCGGDETNRPDFCIINGFNFSRDGCKYHMTIKQLLELRGL